MTVKNSINREIVLKASRDKVWDALTTAEALSQWFGTSATLNNLAVGEEIIFVWDDENLASRGVIETVEPKTRFAYSWENAKYDLSVPLALDNTTLVTFVLEDVEGGTRLILTETGFASLANAQKVYADNTSGWDAELADLKAYLGEA